MRVFDSCSRSGSEFRDRDLAKNETVGCREKWRTLGAGYTDGAEGGNCIQRLGVEFRMTIAA